MIDLSNLTGKLYALGTLVRVREKNGTTRTATVVHVGVAWNNPRKEPWVTYTVSADNIGNFGRLFVEADQIIEGVGSDTKYGS